LSLKTSGDLSSLIIWGTILFTPPIGYFVDRRGRRASLMIYGACLLLFSHLVLALTDVTPFLAMFVLGIAFSLVPAAMWPSVAVIVPEKRLGTAYGLMTSIQNLGLFAFPILAGMITDRVNRPATGQPAAVGTPLDYTATILMFACWAWWDCCSPCSCAGRPAGRAGQPSRVRVTDRPVPGCAGPAGCRDPLQGSARARGGLLPVPQGVIRSRKRGQGLGVLGRCRQRPLVGSHGVGVLLLPVMGVAEGAVQLHRSGKMRRASP